MKDRPSNKLILRTWCSASGCAIWSAIEVLEFNNQDSSAQRKHCSEECYAYKFHKWLEITGRSIEG